MAHELIARNGLIALSGSTFTTINATTSISINGTSLTTLFQAAGSYQTLDGDLTAIAALTGTGFLKRTGTDTWALDTTTYLSTWNDANNYAFKTISISGQSDVVADSNTDTLTFINGTGISLTTNATNDSITVGHSNAVTAATVSDGGVTRTLAFGGTFNIPSVTYDAQGHITSTGTITLTMPANPDTNYYPTTFAWTNGAAAGPTGSLTGTGMSAVSFAAIPTATASVSGIVTTGTQTFAGNKTFNNDLTITGNLIVNGTTMTVNSTTMTVDDPILTLGGDTAPTSNDGKDRGIEFRYYTSGATIGFFGYQNATGNLVFLKEATNTSEVFSGTKGTIDAYISGSNINTGTVGTTYGGTGLDTHAAANGTLLIGNGSGLSLATLTAGSNISITNASGGITINNTYSYTLPLAANGTRGGIQIGYTDTETNRAVVLSSEKAYVTLPRQIPAVTLNGSASTSPSFYAPTTAGTSGNILVSNGSGAPSWSTTGAITVTSININGTKHITANSVTAAGSATTAIVNLDWASNTGAFYDYVIVVGTNRRIGTVMAVHDGTGNVEYTDFSSVSIGTVSVEFTAAISGSYLQLSAVNGSATAATISVMVRSINLI